LPFAHFHHAEPSGIGVEAIKHSENLKTGKKESEEIKTKMKMAYVITLLIEAFGSRFSRPLRYINRVFPTFFFLFSCVLFPLITISLTQSYKIMFRLRFAHPCVVPFYNVFLVFFSYFYFRLGQQKLFISSVCVCLCGLPERIHLS
jgi:hypothetical protein